MTKKEAIRILIDAGVRDIEGSGMGYRSTTDEWRRKVSLAIAKMYPVANGRNLGKSDAFNLRLHLPQDYEFAQ